MTDSEQRAEHFRRAEDSFLLEGLDASRDLEYQAMKAQIIAGELDVDEAIRRSVERFKILAKDDVAELTTAG